MMIYGNIILWMNTKILKRIKFGRYMIAAILTCVMVLIAELTGEKEIIFPEIAALVIGAWIAEKQPWTVNKRRIFLLMTISAFAGVCIVRYLHFPLIAEVVLSFVIIGAALTFAGTTLLPVISACILPVYMGVTSWVYPISVSVMAFLIILFQWIMEKNGLRRKNVYKKPESDYKMECAKWVKLGAVLFLILLLPFKSNYLFITAPPLIVAFAEMSNIKCPARKHPFKIYSILVLAAFSGTALKEVLNMYLHMPLVLCAILACIILFMTFERLNVLFPPAGAILLLPLLLDGWDLKWYPLEVTIGAAVFIAAAMLLFRSNLSQIKEN